MPTTPTPHDHAFSVETLDEKAARLRAELEQARKGVTTVPDKGRFLVYDGKVYRITDMWREQGPTGDGREKWGVVIKREAT